MVPNFEECWSESIVKNGLSLSLVVILSFYVTPCFSHDYQLVLVEYITQQKTQCVCTVREKASETDRDTLFFKNTLLPGHRSDVTYVPELRFFFLCKDRGRGRSPC